MRRTSLGREGTVVLPSEEDLKGRVAALEGEKISTETVEEAVDKPFLTRRGGANGPWGMAGLTKT
jgi:hypothetical protein